jgi:fatty acid CoA ligase FadD9
VETIRLAVAGRRKAINYVSTMAVLDLMRQARAVRAVRNGGKDDAAGYAFSKWTSERLLKDLHDRSGVPVRIYRPSWIMAHREYPGQINTQDAFTRLLQGIVTTSLAPRSFYARGRAAEGVHHDGLPVDVVARSIAALAMAGVERPGYVEYHVVNPHRDVSLDAIVDWVKSAGYRIEQVDDYAAWYQAFRNRLGSLSRSRQRHSPLPLIHTWERPRGDARIPEHQAAGEPSEIPGISEAFIHKYLKDMCALGLIDPAA